MPLISQSWGDFQATDSYAMKLEDKTYGNFIDLSCGYGLDTLNYELTDAVKITTYCLERGRLKARRRTIRPAQVLEASADLLLPEGKPAWSAVHQIAGKNCPRNVFLCYTCSTKPRNSHFIRFPDVLMDQVQRTSKLIEQSDNPAPLTAKTTMHFVQEQTYYAQQAIIVQVVSGTPALYDAVFALPDCQDCSEGDHDAGIYAGLGIAQQTDDGFSTGDDVGYTFTDEVVHGIYASGNTIILVGTKTTPTPDVPFILRSRDGGVSFTNVTPSYGSIKIFYDIVRANDGFYVVGDVGSIFFSRDGYSWTQLSNGGYAGGVYRSVAYDKGTDTTYVAGADAASATTGVVLSVQGTTVADISAQVNGGYGTPPVAWYVVKVLDNDHVAVGGTVGSFAENRYTSEGAEFTAGSVGSTGSTIAALDGDPWTTILGNGDTLYRRDVCGDLTWDEMTVIGGTIAGTFTSIVVGDTTLGVNQLLAVTTEGEIVRIVPMTPDGL